MKNLPANAGDTISILGSEKSPREGMTTHSSVLDLVILRTEDPGGLQSKGSQRFGHDLTAKLQPSQQTNDYLVCFFFFF